MEFRDVLQKRVSCRSYNGKPVSQEAISRILNEMVLAPTARHLQAYRVKVSTDVSFIEGVGKLAKQEERVKGASACMVFFAEKDEFFAIQDATIVCAYAQMVATDEGLASLWMGVFDADGLKQLCGFTNNDEAALLKLKPVSVLILGHTDVEMVRPERKGLKDILI